MWRMQPSGGEEVRGAESRRTWRGFERSHLKPDREIVLGSAWPLPPDEKALIGDLTEDEDHLFLTAILSA